MSLELTLDINYKTKCHLFYFKDNTTGLQCKHAFSLCTSYI